MEDYQASLTAECETEYEFYPCPATLLTEAQFITTFRMCPTSKPILCPDGFCVKHGKDCRMVSECGYGQIQCPDGTCADSLSVCGTQVTCPSSRPFLCEDLSCKANEMDCISLEQCPDETPFRCPDTSCVSERSECPTGRHCDSETPILCDDGECYPDSVDVCEHITVGDCPQGRIRCWDNTCRVSESLCPARSCPPSLPYMCQNGRCVSEESNCPAICEDTTLCLLPPQLGVDLPSYVVRCCDGLSRDECCGFPQTNEQCPSDQVRCGDGVCREPSHCVNGDNCPPDYPYRCGDNECVSDPVACMTKTECGDGWLRCPSGVCVPSYGDCKLPLNRYDGFCDSDLPVMCADGTCAKTLKEVRKIE